MRLDPTIPMFALCIASSCVLKTPTLTARTSSSLPSVPSSEGPPTEGPSSGPSVAPENSHLLEAGCTFSGNDLKGDPGTVYTLSCPPGCDKKADVFGTGVYNGYSAVCVAAIHAGAISERGGEATLVVGAARPAFRGSAQNGVTSRDYGSHHNSFRFEGVRAAPPPPPVVAAAPPLLEAGCTFTGNDLKGDPGTAYTLSCPAGCDKKIDVFGTGVYNGYSAVCVAAIHAGAISERGGEATLVVGAARPAFRGSAQNGVTSRDYGSHHNSFRFEGVRSAASSR
jgi:hypothetical protein